MTVSNSIFQQLCPACATSIPINASRCECGHDLTGAGSALESTLRDEELYENYLVARVEQAREAAHVATRTAEENQADADLLEAATLAREVAESFATDLAEQRTKVQKLRAVVPPPVAALPPVEPPRVEATSAPVVTPVPAPRPEPIITRPAPATPVVVAEPEAVVTAAPAEPPAVILTPTPVTTKTPAVLAIPSPVAMQKAATALSALKQAKAREGAQQLAALRAQIARQKKAEQEKAEREAAPKLLAQPSSTPPTAFREEQAARAERALQDHIGLSGKECPNCTSRVLVNTSRCQCGFSFAGGDTELPSLTLCTGDFTALRNTFLSDLRGRR